MPYTISTHNGSALCRGHNIRAEKFVLGQEHIHTGWDENGERYGYEIWRDETERQAYHRLFDGALGRYNARQKRADRRIDNYYSYVQQDGTHNTAYEMIVGVGSRDNRPDKETCRAILREFYEDWERRNPSLALIGAYYHADEDGAPHVHLDYIPVAHGYKKGLDTQPGLVRAFGEMGLRQEYRREDKKLITAQMQWERQENDALEAICRKYGFEIVHPERGLDVDHVHTELYKLQKDAEDKRMELASLDALAIERRQELAQLAESYQKAHRDARETLAGLTRDIEAKEAEKAVLSSLGADEYDRILSDTFTKNLVGNVIFQTCEQLRERGLADSMTFTQIKKDKILDKLRLSRDLIVSPEHVLANIRRHMTFKLKNRFKDFKDKSI